MSHVLHLGDCVAGMAAMPDRSVDHVITDPPYEAEAHTKQRLTPKGSGRGFSVPESKPITFEAITEEVRAAAALQMGRVARRWVIVFCQAEAIAAWRTVLLAGGLKWKRTMLWVKPDAQPNLMGDRPGVGYETMALAHGPRGRSRWNGGGKCAVYSFNRKHPFSRANEHPTEKPLDLMEALVRDFTDPGELILDPFAGSGTGLVAAKRLGRNALGWELNEAWHAAAVKRLDAAREQFQLPRFPRPRQLQLEGPEKDPGEAA